MRRDNGEWSGKGTLRNTPKLTRAAFNRRYDFIGHLTGPKDLIWDFAPVPELREPKKRAFCQIRPCHLKIRRFRSTVHPLTKIAQKWPAKLPVMRPVTPEIEALTHEGLASRFLKTSRAFPCRPKSV